MPLDDYEIVPSLRSQVPPGVDPRDWYWYTDWYRAHLWQVILARLENPS